MYCSSHNRLILTAAAIATAVVLVPVSAWAVVPTVGTPEEIEQAQTARDRAVAELQQSQLELDSTTAQFIQGAKELVRTRAEVSEVATELANLDASIVKAEQALEERAIELYRGDRVSLIALLLDARTIADFMTRANYLVAINGRDSRMVTGLRQARAESAWLHEHLAERVSRQEALQLSLDKQLGDLDTRMKSLEKRAAELDEDLEALRERVRTFSGGDAQGYFDRNSIISDANFRDADSMTVAEIQAFLEERSGQLDTYRARDHKGRMKSAAEMVAEAAEAWNISPKAILVTLQKESSLLEKHRAQKYYDWAMGCGATDSGRIPKYKGFGTQIWCGAQKLHENTKSWSPGKSRTISGRTVTPTNESTWSLYKYTPHNHGNEMFWLIYWRYFNDPLGDPGQSQNATTTP